jgi:hypothetical protein
VDIVPEFQGFQAIFAKACDCLLSELMQVRFLPGVVAHRGAHEFVQTGWSKLVRKP